MRGAAPDGRTSSAACLSNTHVPGSSAGHATDTPTRLTRRQNRMPIRTASPPLNCTLSRGSRISTAYPRSLRQTGALPDPVRRDVLFRRRAVQHVELNPARVDHHVVRHLAGAERVQAQAHPVVAEDVVAACDGCLDLRRFRVVALEREVEIPRVVADPHVRGLRDRVAVQRVVGAPLIRQRPPASPTPRRRAHRRSSGGVASRHRGDARSGGARCRSRRSDRLGPEGGSDRRRRDRETRRRRGGQTNPAS